MFEVDTSHIPNIPGLSTISSSPTSGVASSTKELINSITTDRESLFSNPMVNVITSANNSVIAVKEKLESIRDGFEINDRISSANANTFLSGSSILNVQSSLFELLGHTNRLSGVLKGQGVELPGLEEIISIGKQMNDYVNILNAGSGCLSIIGGATGLFSGEVINDETNKVADILDRISRNAATIADITEIFDDLSNTVQGIIDKDSQFLQNCVTQLRDAALATALEYVYSDPCAKFVLETVANRNPGGILTKVVGPIG